LSPISVAIHLLRHPGRYCSRRSCNPAVPCHVAAHHHSFGRRRSQSRRLGRRRLWRWWFRRRWRTIRRRRSERIMVMTRKKLIQLIDRERIKEAIERAEHRTSGEIGVSVAAFFCGNGGKAAE